MFLTKEEYFLRGCKEGNFCVINIVVTALWSPLLLFWMTGGKFSLLLAKLRLRWHFVFLLESYET